MIELRPVLRNAIAAVFAMMIVGCHTTRNVTLNENPDATSRPSSVEVLTKSGSTMVVYSPVVEKDSLRGFSDSDRISAVTLAVTDIQSAKTRQLSGSRSALLTIGIIAAVLLAGWIALIAVIFSDDSY